MAAWLAAVWQSGRCRQPTRSPHGSPRADCGDNSWGNNSWRGADKDMIKVMVAVAMADDGDMI